MPLRTGGGALRKADAALGVLTVPTRRCAATLAVALLILPMAVRGLGVDPYDELQCVVLELFGLRNCVGALIMLASLA